VPIFGSPVWERLGIGAAIRRVASSLRLGGDAVERVVFALVGSGRWSRDRSWPRSGGCRSGFAIENLPGCTDDQAYRTMDFLLEPGRPARSLLVAAHARARRPSWTPRTSGRSAPRRCCWPPSGTTQRSTTVARRPDGSATGLGVGRCTW